VVRTSQQQRIDGVLRRGIRCKRHRRTTWRIHRLHVQTCLRPPPQIAKKTFTGKSRLCSENWNLTTRPSGTTPPTTSSWPIPLLRCLELFTGRSGIPTVGFKYRLQVLQKDRRLFKIFLVRDPLFGVKFAYLLDRVFQNLLGNFYNEERPIQGSCSRLKNYQRDFIGRALMGYDVSSIPNLLYLLSSLSAPPPAAPKPEPARQEQRDDRPTEPAWWPRYPNPVSNWSLPNGKKYSDFMTPKTRS
jgi:hypothetical protein